MNALDTLVQKVILKRTGYKALVKENLISGCGDCCYNLEEPGLIKIAPVHRCSMTIVTDGKHQIIFDPLNIPEYCPFRIFEVTAK